MTATLTRRAALGAIASLPAIGSATAATTAAPAATPTPTPTDRASGPVSPKMLQLEAAFWREKGKVERLGAAHTKAEEAHMQVRRALPARPKVPDMPADLMAEIDNMRISELRDKSHPTNIASRAFYAEHEARVAAWEAEIEAHPDDKEVRWRKIDRAYNNQVDRVSRAAERVQSFPAKNLADTIIKMRVDEAWDSDPVDVLPIIFADVARITANA